MYIGTALAQTAYCHNKLSEIAVKDSVRVASFCRSISNMRHFMANEVWASLDYDCSLEYNQINTDQSYHDIFQYISSFDMLLA
ncbi:MAG: hypothetical protein IJU76_02260, partial [Desulfovibrionaceae bacterium]|nr:hypothetical protein [Desulfovibrionaceae bacterium]